METTFYPSIPGRIQNAQGVSHTLLTQYESISKRKNSKKRDKMLEGLIHHIVHVLRRSRGENLLQTTAIWILSSILRLEGGDDANFQKNIMVAAGIPGVVHDILLENKMSGSTREYASELCFYLWLVIDIIFLLYFLFKYGL